MQLDVVSRFCLLCAVIGVCRTVNHTVNSLVYSNYRVNILRPDFIYKLKCYNNKFIMYFLFAEPPKNRYARRQSGALFFNSDELYWFSFAFR
jgi:hypothetical protein